MHFARPESLWWLVGVAFVGLLGIRAGIRRRRIMADFAESRMLARLAAEYSPTRARLKLALFLAGLTLLVLALARPQWGSELVRVERRGMDIVFAVDLSASMNARDYPPSRLAVARRELQDLTRQLQGNRLGLVGFAGTAFPFCPLTLDSSATRLFLDQMDPDVMPVPGTSIGSAVQTALQSFPAGDPNEKAIVLLTDGEDHHSHPLDAARAAAKQGVRIDAVAIGSVAGEPIPEYDPSGKVIGYIKDAQGKTVMSRVDEPLLQQMASLTGGTYTHALPGVDMLAPVRAALRATQKRALESTLQRRYPDRFSIFLVVGLVLLALERTLGTRRRTAARAAVPSAAAALLGFLLLAPTPAHAQAGPVAASRYVLRMAQGNRGFERGDYAAAERAYRAALAGRPGSAQAHDNLGETLYRENRFGEAAGEFQKASEAAEGSPEVREQATYNRGNAFYRQHRLDDAAGAYKQALRLDENDADARHNLEVVLRQLQHQKKKPPKPKPKPKSGKRPRKKPRGNQKPSKGNSQNGRKPAPRRQKQPSPSGMTRRDAERILRYFQDQERAAMARRRKAAHAAAGSGSVQEPW